MLWVIVLIMGGIAAAAMKLDAKKEYNLENIANESVTPADPLTPDINLVLLSLAWLPP